MSKLSVHFDSKEFACRHCGKVPSLGALNVLVLGLEKMRAAAYPTGLRIVSGYRCPAHNAAVGGASQSQHMLGAAADVPMVMTLDDVKRLGVFSGIGWQLVGKQKLVRHVDVRHLARNLTGGTPLRPTVWEYLADGSRR